jgi:hypothetical protein
MQRLILCFVTVTFLLQVAAYRRNALTSLNDLLPVQPLSLSITPAPHFGLDDEIEGANINSESAAAAQDLAGVLREVEARAVALGAQLSHSSAAQRAMSRAYAWSWEPTLATVSPKAAAMEIRARRYLS